MWINGMERNRIWDGRGESTRGETEQGHPINLSSPLKEKYLVGGGGEGGIKRTYYIDSQDKVIKHQAKEKGGGGMVDSGVGESF